MTKIKLDIEKRAAPVTSMVRVARKQTVDIVEYVDVEICRFPDEYTDLADVALDLVKAKEAAGEDVAWILVSEKPAKYVAPDYEAAALPGEPEIEPPTTSDR